MGTESNLNELTNNSAPITSTDPQVKTTRQYSPRRAFSNSYKVRILAAYEACETASGRGELLRREGLYHSRISVWKHEQAAGKLDRKEGKKHTKAITRMEHLSRENEQLKKKLAQAEAMIDLQKKVSELLGEHILPLTNNEEK